MNKLFPISHVTFRKILMDGSVVGHWPAPKLNMKTKVVCEPCNIGWMSRLENNYAKPAMTDLILGKRLETIGKKRAYGLSLFAFKPAVIANRSLPESEFFFDTSERYAFRNSLTIPPDVAMWLVGMEPVMGGGIGSFNVRFEPDISLNVCSFWIGQLGFQVVSAKSRGPNKIESLPTPPNLTVLFHPIVESNVRWPRPRVLSIKAFNDFGNRWTAIRRR
jgi:hypothetical protein